MRVVKINLHHIKAATAVLRRLFEQERDDVALIQEPRETGSRIAGVPLVDRNVFCGRGTNNPRTSIVVMNNIEIVVYIFCMWAQEDGGCYLFQLTLIKL